MWWRLLFIADKPSLVNVIGSFGFLFQVLTCGGRGCVRGGSWRKVRDVDRLLARSLACEFFEDSECWFYTSENLNR